MHALSRAQTSLQTHPKVLGVSELRGSRALIRGLSHLSHSRFWIESLNKECVFPWHQTWLTGGDLGPDHAECVQLAWGSGEPKGELCGLLNGSGQKYWKNLPGISREALFCFQVSCFSWSNCRPPAFHKQTAQLFSSSFLKQLCTLSTQAQIASLPVHQL